jgi:hypothetical protein
MENCGSEVLIVSDADGREPASIVRDFKSRLTVNYGFAVIPIVAVEMLEALAIADPLALRKVLSVRKDFASPERIRNPKVAMQRALPSPMTSFRLKKFRTLILSIM